MPAYYVSNVATACGISLLPEEFESAQRKSGGKKTRIKKWTTVMRALVEARGKNWDDLKEEARSAFGSAIRERASTIPIGDLPWAQSIAGRLEAYLAERS
jgi:hypothetical protein